MWTIPSGQPSPPRAEYCPYCGREGIKRVDGVAHCTSCRAVFFVRFSRYARKSPASGMGQDIAVDRQEPDTGA